MPRAPEYLEFLEQFRHRRIRLTGPLATQALSEKHLEEEGPGFYTLSAEGQQVVDQERDRLLATAARRAERRRLVELMMTGCAALRAGPAELVLARAHTLADELMARRELEEKEPVE